MQKGQGALAKQHLAGEQVKSVAKRISKRQLRERRRAEKEQRRRHHEQAGMEHIGLPIITASPEWAVPATHSAAASPAATHLDDEPVKQRRTRGAYHNEVRPLGRPLLGDVSAFLASVPPGKVNLPALEAAFSGADQLYFVRVCGSRRKEIAIQVASAGGDWIGVPIRGCHLPGCSCPWDLLIIADRPVCNEALCAKDHRIWAADAVWTLRERVVHALSHKTELLWGSPYWVGLLKYVPVCEAAGAA